MKSHLIPHRSLLSLAVSCALAGTAFSVEPARPGYTPELRLDAKDAGVILRHGDGPNQCDINGAREPTLIFEDGKYYLFYDGGGPKGWLACLATSTDMKTWTKHGPVLDFGAPGEPDAGGALSPWFIKEWFLFANHIRAIDPMFTDAIWVFWTKDLEKWESENRAIALDGVNCTWSKRCIGMATVTRIGNRLAMVYDAAGGDSTSHLGRDIGLAWYDLPLQPPAR